MAVVNFANLLAFHARSEPEKPGLVEGDRQMTFAEIESWTNRFAHHLDRIGTAKTDRVLIYAYNTFEFVIAFFGAMKHGAIPVPVNKRLEGEDLQRVVRHANPHVIVAHAADVSRFAGSTAQMLSFADRGGGALWDTLRPLPVTRELEGAQAHRIANILYTSGTTGMPKAAIHTHHMRHAVAGAMTNRFELSRGDVGLAVSPFFHTGGLSVLCNCLFVGATCVLMPRWEPERMLAEVTRNKVTFAHFVSTLIVDITNLPETALCGFEPRLRMTWAGGHSVDTWRLGAYERRMGGVLLQGYSRTEGGLTYNFPDPARRSFGHNGFACLDSSEVAIYDSRSGGFCPSGLPGEIIVRGDGVSPGYWEDGALREPDRVLGDWARTGDSGFLDADGALHFQGRIDHMIKSGGENVFPAEVEKAIIRNPGVGNVIVLGTADQRYGEIVSALVVPLSPDLTEAGLRQFLRDKLAGYKIPKLIRFIDDLPRLGSGKVDLAQSRRLLTSCRVENK